MWVVFFVAEDPIYTYLRQPNGSGDEKEEQKTESSNSDDVKEIFGEDFVAWAKDYSQHTKESGYLSREGIK